jgi:hypothetical protein
MVAAMVVGVVMMRSITMIVATVATMLFYSIMELLIGRLSIIIASVGSAGLAIMMLMMATMLVVAVVVLLVRLHEAG